MRTLKMIRIGDFMSAPGFCPVGFYINYGFWGSLLHPHLRPLGAMFAVHFC